MRVEVEGFRSSPAQPSEDDYSRPSSPVKGVHTPQRPPPMVSGIEFVSVVALTFDLD